MRMHLHIFLMYIFYKKKVLKKVFIVFIKYKYMWYAAGVTTVVGC